MSNSKKYLCFGLIFNGISCLIRQLDIFYIILPDFIKDFFEGITLGLGLVLILFGLYIASDNLQNIKKYKLKIFNKIMIK